LKKDFLALKTFTPPKSKAELTDAAFPAGAMPLQYRGDRTQQGQFEYIICQQ
jgi:hypothetical protein